MQRSLLALALIATAGVSSVSYAQTVMTRTTTTTQTQASEPLDPYGRPLIGRNDWVRQPGDERGPVAGNPNMAAMPPAPAPMTQPMQSGPHQATFKDEYGFRYDAQGNRLDGRGNIISPQTR